MTELNKEALGAAVKALGNHHANTTFTGERLCQLVIQTYLDALPKLSDDKLVEVVPASLVALVISRVEQVFTKTAYSRDFERHWKAYSGDIAHAAIAAVREYDVQVQTTGGES